MTWLEAQQRATGGVLIRRFAWQYWIDVNRRVWTRDGEVLKAHEFTFEDAHAWDWTTEPWEGQSVCARPPRQAPLLPVQTRRFLILRYSWTSGAGTDLDTRTALVDIDDAIAGIDVGWGASRRTALADSLGAPFLTWSGDETGVGTEAVAIDIERIVATFPELGSIRLRMRANWFSTRLTGDVGLEATVWQGIRLQAESASFTMAGGSVLAAATTTANAASNTAGDVDGSNLGYLVLATADDSITFEA